VKIYLDLCAIQRPLDTPNEVRIVLESEAVLGIIAYCDIGKAELLSSEALLYEGEQSALPIRQDLLDQFFQRQKRVVLLAKTKKPEQHL
jgi:hypothetical protein